MTINELHIQLDLQPENRIDTLRDVAMSFRKGYLFVDSNDGHCCLFNENGNEDNIKRLTKINNVLFYNSNIESIVIPDSIKSIGDGAFAECKSLKSIKIPNSVKNIGHGAFKYCISLTSIAIPDSIESIGHYIFAYCKNLTSIEIPDSVEMIGHRACWNCEKLKSLIFKGKTIDQVKAMENYPFGIEDESIIRCC
ncbi:MAG: leucine-rich repeat domain-containing protein [Methanobrevibacter sp.]|nr:leucine-rich repeat domain-containing protein [Methanobrevibacter sp.]